MKEKFAVSLMCMDFLKVGEQPRLSLSVKSLETTHLCGFRDFFISMFSFDFA